MPEWLWVILVGGVILGLVTLIYGVQDRRVAKIEEWKEKVPMAEEILIKSSHAVICDTKVEKFEKSVSKQIDDIKAYFDMKIERDILMELRKLNGK